LNIVTSRQCLFFPFVAFLWYPTPGTIHRFVQTIWIWWWWPVTKGSLLAEKGNLTAIYIFYSRNFLDNPHLALYAQCSQAVTFFCDQSVLTGTLFVEQRIFTALSRLRFEGFSWNSTPVTTRALPTKGLKLSSANNEEHIILWMHLCFISRELSETPHQTFYVHCV